MTTENLTTESAAGESTANAQASADTSTQVEASSANVPRGTADQSSDATAAAAAGVAGAPVVPQSYQPNYKYRAAMEEKEIEEFWRPLMKDAESEKRVKQLFTKVDGFDALKQSRDQLRNQFETLDGDFKNMSQTVHRFNDSVARGDLSSAFRLAGITNEQIFRWTQQQLQLMEMSPEQRQHYEKTQQTQSQNYELQQQVSQLQQAFQDSTVQARSVQLEVTLSRPDIASFANSWDSNAGTPGAFRQFVIDEAKKVYYDSGRDLSPDEAVGMVMSRFGKFLNAGGTPAAPVAGQATVGSSAQSAKPVIPNVSGKAASPVKKVPRSLDDLKKLAKEAKSL